jgi:hypothetical protein
MSRSYVCTARLDARIARDPDIAAILDEIVMTWRERRDQIERQGDTPRFAKGSVAIARRPLETFADADVVRVVRALAERADLRALVGRARAERTP